jgi:ribonuclease HII
MPDFSLEDAAHAAGQGLICGVDEAGRGPWAGPVVAAAVILDRTTLPPGLMGGLDDSKKLKPARRRALLDELQGFAVIGVNILEATMLAMIRAVEDLSARPDLALIDGNRGPKLQSPVQCVVKGDGKSLSIAAASIVAKVTRDKIMADLADAFPGYGWERNAGYGTKEHQGALARLGVTPEHRRSYAPIRKILGL